jgi:hypothetical protein
VHQALPVAAGPQQGLPFGTGHFPHQAVPKAAPSEAGCRREAQPALPGLPGRPPAPGPGSAQAACRGAPRRPPRHPSWAAAGPRPWLPLALSPRRALAWPSAAGAPCQAAAAGSAGGSSGDERAEATIRAIRAVRTGGASAQRPPGTDASASAWLSCGSSPGCARVRRWIQSGAGAARRRAGPPERAHATARPPHLLGQRHEGHLLLLRVGRARLLQQEAACGRGAEAGARFTVPPPPPPSPPPSDEHLWGLIWPRSTTPTGQSSCL